MVSTTRSRGQHKPASSHPTSTRPSTHQPIHSSTNPRMRPLIHPSTRPPMRPSSPPPARPFARVTPPNLDSRLAKEVDEMEAKLSEISGPRFMTREEIKAYGVKLREKTNVYVRVKPLAGPGKANHHPSPTLIYHPLTTTNESAPPIQSTTHPSAGATCGRTLGIAKKS